MQQILYYLTVASMELIIAPYIILSNDTASSYGRPDSQSTHLSCTRRCLYQYLQIQSSSSTKLIILSQMGDRQDMEKIRQWLQIIIIDAESQASIKSISF